MKMIPDILDIGLGTVVKSVHNYEYIDLTENKACNTTKILCRYSTKYPSCYYSNRVTMLHEVHY